MSDVASSLRKKRNWAVIIAIVAILGSMGASLPRAISRHRDLKATNEQLLALQAQIVASQQRIREVQAEIGKVQAEIIRIQTRGHE
jgi:predicted  nucleic acid-binding Zn-ribbon protein